MMLFPAIGLVLWIAFLIVAFVLFATIWGLSNVILRLLGLKPRLTGPQAAASPRRNQPPVPVPDQARPRVPVRAGPPQVEPDIWPKWTPSRRLYMDRELALWQQQFDALALHEPDVIMAAAIQRRSGTTTSV
ncbi:hypothetical protein [Pseudarthrobacter sp. AB1]|uniref:hypothetical protein n=1 Tax=Pseudarthrobacter sp. AB1 TaxID=2138309 RepID=UPI00186B7D46|nr:hypothetical protein [Pseudarthrobacter sp. AB1]MBE4718046.1 hypothetical protein [Pseudarthrobacter sp. AB1]